MIIAYVIEYYFSMIIRFLTIDGGGIVKKLSFIFFDDTYLEKFSYY